MTRIDATALSRRERSTGTQPDGAMRAYHERSI